MMGRISERAESAPILYARRRFPLKWAAPPEVGASFYTFKFRKNLIGPHCAVRSGHATPPLWVTRQNITEIPGTD